MTQVRDNIGRVVNYVYDADGRLWRVIDPAGGVTEYTYNASHRMTALRYRRAQQHHHLHLRQHGSAGDAHRPVDARREL